MKNHRSIVLTVIALSALVSIIAAAFLAYLNNGNWGFFLLYAALAALLLYEDDDAPDGQAKP